MNRNDTATKQGPDVYEWTGPTGVHFRDIREPSGTYYREGTPRAVVDALESAMHSDARVRLFLGDKETGKDWCDEYDVAGRVGRTMGPICAPILLHSQRSIGGGIILTDCIVRLMVNGREVYRHPKYTAPEYTVHAIERGAKIGKVDLREAGYTCTVEGTGANFKTAKQAHRYAAFMRGERASK